MRYVKTILIVLLVVVLLGGAGFGVYWFFLRPTPLKGTMVNSHTISLCVRGNTYFDVQVPNEAKLLETDETSIYTYDLLTVAIQDTEPQADYKVQVEGRWVYAYSDEDWLAPVAESLHKNSAYEVTPRYSDPAKETWNDGPYPAMSGAAVDHGELTHVHKEGGFLVNVSDYGTWEETKEILLARLCKLSGDYVPQYYEDEELFYAETGGYAVGMRYINYNTNTVLVAGGDVAINELKYILTGGEIGG